MLLLTFLTFCLTFTISTVLSIVYTFEHDPSLMQHRNTRDVVDTWAPVKLRSHQKKEMQREILNLLGLQHRPKPRMVANSQNSSAPMFMLDLYRSLNSVEQDVSETENNDYNFHATSSASGSGNINNMRWMTGTLFNYTMNEVTALNQADTIMSLPGKIMMRESENSFTFDHTFLDHSNVELSDNLSFDARPEDEVPS